MNFNKYIKPIVNYIGKMFKKKDGQFNFDHEELAIKIPAVFTFSSAIEVMEIMKTCGVGAVPVISLTGSIVGLITEKDLANFVALQSVSGWSELKGLSVDSIVTEASLVIPESATLEEITTEFTNKDVELIPLVSDLGLYTGYSITPFRMVTYVANSIKPRTIGGLATPLGVYLTDGYHNAGAGVLGLILTGIAFSIVINIISIISLFCIEPYTNSQTLLLIFQLGSFLLILRLSPLVAYHSAEHQTIHAIERGVDLTLENVRNQPKEHERCGTNLMILMFGLSLLFLLSIDFFKYLEVWQHSLILIVLSILVISNWKPLGMKLQKFFTTAKPNDKQLESGIKAGLELLNNYNNNSKPVKTRLFIKIWNMGIIQVLCSFMIVSYIIQSALSYFWSI